jgi:fatty acid desaturase
MENETTQPNPVNESPKYNPMSVGDWLITGLIFYIPIVGFVMLFVWGFGSNTQPSKANWAKATLIMIGISIVIFLLFFGSILGVLIN